MTERLLRIDEVKARTGLGRSNIYKRMALGKFPRHVPLGGGIVAWLESEIDAWISETVLAARERATLTA